MNRIWEQQGTIMKVIKVQRNLLVKLILLILFYILDHDTMYDKIMLPSKQDISERKTKSSTMH